MRAFKTFVFAESIPFAGTSYLTRLDETQTLALPHRRTASDYLQVQRTTLCKGNFAKRHITCFELSDVKLVRLQWSCVRRDGDPPAHRYSLHGYSSGTGRHSR